MLSSWSKERVIGTGSLGDVWLVRDSRTGTLGVLKVYPAQLAEIRDRVLHELLQIKHSNLQRTLETGVDDEGRMYVVTEYIEGRSLRNVLVHGGTLAPNAVKTLGLALLSGLAVLERQGMVHRDIKPDNVLIPNGTDFERAVLIDFGFLGRREFGEGNQSRTMSGVLVGSVAYMSPEQASGAGLSHQSDLWALGVVLYEAATGRRPFDSGGSPANVLVGIMTRTADLGPVPVELRAAIGWALERELVSRVPTAAEFRRALETGVRGEHPASDTTTTFASPVTTSHAPLASESRAPAPVSVSVAPSAARTRAPQASMRWIVPIGAGVAGVAFLLWRAPRFGVALAAGLAAGALVGLSLYWKLRAPVRTAQSVKSRAEGKNRVTESIAITVEQMAVRYRTNPHAQLITQSLALVFEQYQAVTATDPQARLELTLKALDAMMKLEARIAQIDSPWYQRYDKPVAVMTAIGTACVTWWGFGQTVVKASQPEALGLFSGCPEMPIAPGTRARLEGNAGSPLEWSLSDKVVFVGHSLRWPEDVVAGVSKPGTYSIWAKSGERKQRCAIEVRDAAPPTGPSSQVPAPSAH